MSCKHNFAVAQIIWTTLPRTGHRPAISSASHGTATSGKHGVQGLICSKTGPMGPTVTFLVGERETALRLCHGTCATKPRFARGRLSRVWCAIQARVASSKPCRNSDERGRQEEGASHAASAAARGAAPPPCEWRAHRRGICSSKARAAEHGDGHAGRTPCEAARAAKVGTRLAPASAITDVGSDGAAGGRRGGGLFAQAIAGVDGLERTAHDFADAPAAEPVR